MIYHGNSTRHKDVCILLSQCATLILNHCYNIRGKNCKLLGLMTLQTFYIYMNIYMIYISVWYGNSSNQDCKALQRVVRLAERISGSTLPSLQDIYFKRCKSRAAKIIKDSTHPGNHLFRLLPSGKRFRSMMAKTRETEEELLPPGHQAP